MAVNNPKCLDYKMHSLIMKDCCLTIVRTTSEIWISNDFAHTILPDVFRYGYSGHEIYAQAVFMRQKALHIYVIQAQLLHWKTSIINKVEESKTSEEQSKSSGVTFLTEHAPNANKYDY